MGQIKIKKNLGEGRYTVEIMRDIERSKTRKKQLEDHVKDLEKKTPELKKAYDEALAKELVKRQEAEIRMVELETDTSEIDQLRSDYDSQTFQLESNQTSLKSKQNTKDGLQAAIDSGNYTGVDLTNLQSQLTAVNSDISDINAQITANQNEIKRIEAAIADLENPTKRIKELNELFSGIMAVVFETRKYKLALDYNNLTIEAKKKKIAEYKDINSVIDIRDAWCVDYAIDLDEGLEDLAAQLDEISGNLGLQKNYKITNQSKLVELQSAGVANDDPQIVAVKEAIKNNQDEIDALTLQKNELLKKEMRVSVDINDENNHILIAPYTYEVVQKDIDEKTVYIQKQIDKKDGYLDEVDKLQGQITALQTYISDAYADITDTSRLLAYIGGDSTDDEYIIARRKNLQDKIDQLRKDIENYNRQITKATQQQKKWQTKADVLIKRILLLNDELKDLNTAFSSAEKILTPTVTDRTRQFQPVLSSSPEAVYFNKALLPGVQKWMPTYRLGTITAMGDNDLCTVELAEAESSQQQLDINQHRILENVRIKYGSCNSGAFEVGDRVVVEFQNREQDSPTVIGFEDNPRTCGVYLTYTNYPGTERWFHLDKYPDHIVNNDFHADGKHWRHKAHIIGWKITQVDSSRWDTRIYVRGKYFDWPFRRVVTAAISGNTCAVVYFYSTEDSPAEYYYTNFELDFSGSDVIKFRQYGNYLLLESRQSRDGDNVYDVTISDDLDTCAFLLSDGSICLITGLYKINFNKTFPVLYNNGKFIRRITSDWSTPAKTAVNVDTGASMHALGIRAFHKGFLFKSGTDLRNYPSSKGTRSSSQVIEGGNGKITSFLCGKLIGKKLYFCHLTYESHNASSSAEYLATRTIIPGAAIDEYLDSSVVGGRQDTVLLDTDYSLSGSESSAGYLAVSVYDITDKTIIEVVRLNDFSKTGSHTISVSHTAAKDVATIADQGKPGVPELYTTPGSSYLKQSLIRYSILYFDPAEEFYAFVVEDYSSTNIHNYADYPQSDTLASYSTVVNYDIVIYNKGVFSKVATIPYTDSGSYNGPSAGTGPISSSLDQASLASGIATQDAGINRFSLSAYNSKIFKASINGGYMNLRNIELIFTTDTNNVEFFENTDAGGAEPAFVKQNITLSSTRKK